MTIASLASVGPVRAAELAMTARNDAARAHSEAETVIVEVVRPVAATTLSRKGGEPATERLRIDISV